MVVVVGAVDVRHVLVPWRGAPWCPRRLPGYVGGVSNVVPHQRAVASYSRRGSKNILRMTLVIFFAKKREDKAEASQVFHVMICRWAIAPVKW